MSDTPKPPLISCLVTVYNERHLATTAITSLLNQSFEDFEIVIVDDGADEETRETILRIEDPRIKYIRQANDGLSSARNRGLKHCKGEYVTFLDADDTRPNWAFARMAEEIRANSPDCVFMAGMLSELRHEMTGFYDTDIIAHMIEASGGLTHFRTGDAFFAKWLEFCLLIEPQCANKLVRRSFIEAHALSFPSGFYYEDMLFHTGLINHMASFSLIEMPMFTYYRRYGHSQITAGAGMNRFDAVTVGRMTLEVFAASPKFHRVELRLALLLGMFKLISWCHVTVSHTHKYQFHLAVKLMMTTLDPRYLEALDHERDLNPLTRKLSWMPHILHYIRCYRDEVRPAVTHMLREAPVEERSIESRQLAFSERGIFFLRRIKRRLMRQSPPTYV